MDIGILKFYKYEGRLCNLYGKHFTNIFRRLIVHILLTFASTFLEGVIALGVIRNHRKINASKGTFVIGNIVSLELRIITLKRFSILMTFEEMFSALKSLKEKTFHERPAIVT